MDKVVVFGNLPVWVGGKQSSGASVVMWQLSNAINERQQNLKLIFVATDIFKESIKIEKTDVKGWTYKLIIKLIITNIGRVFFYQRASLGLSQQYGLPFISTFIKLIWFDSIVKTNKDAMFHTHGTDYFIIVRQVLNKNKVSIKQVIHTVHAIAGNDSKIHGFLTERKREALLATSHPQKIVFVSQLLKKEWESHYKNDGIVIPNAVKEEYLGLVRNNKIVSRDYTGNSKSLLTIGSISNRKGQFRVLQAVARSKFKSSITYKCIGPGKKSDIAELIEFSKKNEVNFLYLGVLPPKDIMSELSKSHFMILPSSSEGFGLVFEESIITGTPIILPKDLPFVKQANVNQKNSILLDDYSIRSVGEVLDNINSYKFNNWDVARSFNPLSWSDIAGEYLKVYSKVV